MKPAPSLVARADTNGKVSVEARRDSVENLLSALKDAKDAASAINRSLTNREREGGGRNRHTYSIDQLPHIPKTKMIPESVLRMQHSVDNLEKPKVRRSLPVLGKPNPTAWSRKADLAKDRRALHEMSKQKALLDKLENKKTRLVAFRERSEIADRQSKWLKLVKLACITQAMLDVNARHKDAALANEAYEKAALMIQKSLRKAYASKMENRFRGVSAILIKYEWKARLNLRTGQRKRYAQAIRQFFRDHAGDDEFASIVKSYRFKVVRAQRCVRHFLRCKEQRLAALCKIWEMFVARFDSTNRPYIKGASKPSKPSKDMVLNDADNRQSRIIEEGKQEIAGIAQKWNITKARIVALADYKDQFAMPMSPQDEPMNSPSTSYRKTSKQRIAELLRMVEKRPPHATTPKISRKLRLESLRKILKSERLKHIHGDYARYQINKAFFSPNEVAIKKNNSLSDAKKMITRTVLDGKLERKELAEEPQPPIWLLYSKLDIKKFEDEVSARLTEAKIKALENFEAIDLFNA